MKKDRGFLRIPIIILTAAGSGKSEFTVECEGGKVVVLGYYHGKFRGRAEEFKAQVAHIWTIREGQAVKFQQYLDTLQIARDSGAVSG